jgi:putative ABC transport system substrate-binding protein
VAIEYRWAEGRYDRLSALASDLVRRKVAVILASTTIAARAAKDATSTIPIVFTSASDPVQFGLVGSLSRPAGNLTGFTTSSGALEAKRVELLHELVPSATTIGVLVNPTNTIAESNVVDMQAAVRAHGEKVLVQRVGSELDIAAAFAGLDRQRVAALLVATDPFFGEHREQLVTLAARYSVPTMYVRREFATSGGLISYGADATDEYRQAGAYSGRILKGAKPSDLPVQQPTKFELVINLKTAKALGLAVPLTLQASADEVIE